jgi:hypothetical protein
MPTDPNLDPSNIVWESSVDPNLDPSNIVWDTPTRAAPDVQAEPQQRTFDPQFPKVLEYADIPFGVVKPFRNLHEVGRMALGGGLDIVRGLATLPFDIGELFGSEGARKISENISRAIPDVPAHSVPEKIGQVFTQYGIPQVAAFKLMQGIMAGSHWALQFASKMFAGGLSDFLVAAPDEKSIMSRIGAESKTHLGERAKIGAEGAIIGGAAEGIFTVARKAGGIGKEVYQRIANPRALAEDAVGKALAKEALDPERAIISIRNNLDELAAGRYEPTTASVADDLGLVGVEQAVGREPGFSKYFVERGEINMRAISDTLEDVVDSMGGNGQRAKAYFEELINNTIAGKENAVKAADEALEIALKETDNWADEVVKEFDKTTKGNASVLLDSEITSQHQILTRNKNKLYEMIDPNNTVPINKNRFFEEVKKLFKRKDDFDRSTKRMSAGLKDALKSKIKKTPAKVEVSKVLDASGKPITTKIPAKTKFKDVTFGEINSLRKEVTTALSEAINNNDGALIGKLRNFKGYLDSLPEEVMAQGGRAGQIAKVANDYFKEVVVPRFRQGVGQKYTEALRSKYPIPSEDVAKKFLRSPSGARETVKQLKLIISKSQNKAQAEKAIEDWIISDVADSLYTQAGKIKPKAFDNYLKNMRAQLKSYPNVIKKLEKYQKSLGGRISKQTELGKRIQLARADLKKTTKDVKRTAAQYFVDSDPTQAVGGALSSPDPVKAFKDLAMLAKKDPSGEAIQGLRQALSDFIEKSVRGTRDAGGKAVVIRDKFFKLFDNKVTKEAISQLYTPTEMKKLDEVRKYLRAEEAIAKRVKTPLPSKETEKTIQKARILLASIYGIIKGRGIFAISDWVMKALGRDPKVIANQVLTEAMLDPELAAILLDRQTAKALPRIKERFTAWLINNVYDEKLADESE